MRFNPRAARKEALTSRETVMKPEELERMRQYTTVRSANLCRSFLMRELLRHPAGKPVTIADAAFMATHLYEAGRMDGKREERARRRAQQPATARPR